MLKKRLLGPLSIEIMRMQALTLISSRSRGRRQQERCRNDHETKRRDGSHGLVLTEQISSADADDDKEDDERECMFLSGKESCASAILAVVLLSLPASFAEGN